MMRFKATGRTVLLPVALAAVLALGGCGIFKGKGDKKTPTLGERVPILLSENQAVVDPTIAQVQVLLPPATANEAWAQPGGTPDKAMGHLALAASPTRAWSVQIDGGSNRNRLGASPVIAGGTLYVVDVDAVVHAFAADTGAKRWQHAIAEGKENRTARFGGGVSFDDNRLYATDGVGDVVALNAADGTEIWRAKPGGPLRGAPTVANGQVYVLSQDNQLFALDLGDGKVVWTQSASLESQGVFGVAAPAAASGTVVAGFSSGELNAYRYENGRTLWQEALSRSSATTSVSSLADIDANPVIVDGRAYAIGEGGRMVSVDLSTGQRFWEQNFAGISTPATAGDWLFVITDDARLVCIARTSGKIRWIAQLQAFKNEKKRTNAYNWFGPVLAGDRLWLTNSRGDLVAVSPQDGTVQATLDAGDSFSLPPVVSNSTMYLLDNRGRVSAWR